MSLLTLGGVFNTLPLAEPTWDSGHPSVANAVVGARSTPTTRIILSGEMLKTVSMKCQEKSNSVTHLSEIGSGFDRRWGWALVRR